MELRNLKPEFWNYEVTKKYFELDGLDYFETMGDDNINMIKKVLGDFKSKITVQIEVIFNNNIFLL